jgi:hypothetical protein
MDAGFIATGLGDADKKSQQAPVFLDGEACPSKVPERVPLQPAGNAASAPPPVHDGDQGSVVGLPQLPEPRDARLPEGAGSCSRAPA